MKTTLDSQATRSLLVAGVLVLAAACGTDGSTAEESDASLVASGPGVVEDGQSEPATETDAEPAAAVEEPTDDGEGGDGSDDTSSAPAGGEVTIEADIDFSAEPIVGTFAIAVGADVLGCESGTFTERSIATGIERVMTCDEGARTGTVTIRFTPEGDSGPWGVHAATGDFVGLQGGGEFTVVFDDENERGSQTLSGDIVYGAEPTAEVDVAASPVEPTEGLDEAFVAFHVDRLEVPDDRGAVVVSVHEAEGTKVSAAAGSDSSGNVPDPSDAIRGTGAGHLMTILTTLTLVDDGLIALDDPVSDHVTRVPVPDAVTVRDLLAGTSGIPDFVSTDGFIDDVLTDQSRRWTPEESVALVAGLEPEFVPGTEQRISNTNGIITGILIEEVTRQPVHQAMRERVIVPAEMTSTYYPIAEDGPEPFETYLVIDGEPVLSGDVDFTAVDTSAWVFGAISSADDIHALFTAIDAGTIISPESFAEMTASDEIGFGIELIGPDKNILATGNGLPGASTYVAHMPETGQTAVFASTSDDLRFGPAVDPILDEMLAEAGTGTG